MHFIFFWVLNNSQAIEGVLILRVIHFHWIFENNQKVPSDRRPPYPHQNYRKKIPQKKHTYSWLGDSLNGGGLERPMNFREASLAITPKHHNCCASLQTPEAWNPVWSSLGNCLRLNHLPIFRDSLVLLKELFFSGKTSSFLFVCSFFFVGYFCLKIPDIFTSNSYMCWFEKKWIVARWSHINSSDFEDFFFDWKSELLDE